MAGSRSCHADPLEPADLCHIIARFVLLEHLKARTGDGAAGDVGALAHALPKLTSLHLTRRAAYRLLSCGGVGEQCSRLRDLELEDEQHALRGPELAALATLTRLTGLKLQCSRIDGAGSGVQHVCSELGRLRSLSLQASVPAETAMQLPGALAGLTALTLLKPRSGSSGGGRHELGEQLAALSDLRRLETDYYLHDDNERQRQAFSGLSRLTALVLPERRAPAGCTPLRCTHSSSWSSCAPRWSPCSTPPCSSPTAACTTSSSAGCPRCRWRSRACPPSAAPSSRWT